MVYRSTKSLRCKLFAERIENSVLVAPYSEILVREHIPASVDPYRRYANHPLASKRIPRVDRFT